LLKNIIGGEGVAKDKLSSNYLHIMSIQNANVIHPFYTHYQLDYANLLMAQKFYYLIEFLKILKINKYYIKKHSIAQYYSK
jgi:hypothetical protein